MSAGWNGAELKVENVVESSGVVSFRKLELVPVEKKPNRSRAFSLMHHIMRKLGVQVWIPCRTFMDEVECVSFS